MGGCDASITTEQGKLASLKLQILLIMFIT